VRETVKKKSKYKPEFDDRSTGVKGRSTEKIQRVTHSDRSTGPIKQSTGSRNKNPKFSLRQRRSTGVRVRSTGAV